MICPIKRDFKQSEDFCRKDKTSGEWIVKYFQKHPRHPDYGTEKRDCTPLHCGKSGIEKQAKRRGTGAYRFCGKISSRKGLFGEGFSVFYFCPKRIPVLESFRSKAHTDSRRQPGDKPACDKALERKSYTGKQWEAYITNRVKRTWVHSGCLERCVGR